MKIYTKTGDNGETALFGGSRLPKNHIKIEAYGTVDELNSHLGIVASFCDVEEQKFLYAIQSRLFDIGAHLAADNSKKNIKLPNLDIKIITDLELRIDLHNEVLESLTNFILPSGHLAIAQCHVARTVCRRAERTVVALHHIENQHPIIIPYLNRLSDYIFILARRMAKDLHINEVIWQPFVYKK
jgi:cob(I)alamin adenosyltransferase